LVCIATRRDDPDSDPRPVSLRKPAWDVILDGHGPDASDPDACAVHFKRDAEGWCDACRLTALIWKNTAFVRFDPTDRLDRARRYDGTASPIAVGKKPEELGIPGLGLAPLNSAPGQRGRVTAPASSEFSGR
jgi:hypothetical protein